MNLASTPKSDSKFTRLGIKIQAENRCSKFDVETTEAEARMKWIDYNNHQA